VTRINAQLEPGDQVELYSSAESERPYFVGVVDRVLHTREALTVKLLAEAPPIVAEVEEEEMPESAFPRPRGWT